MRRLVVSRMRAFEIHPIKFRAGKRGALNACVGKARSGSKFRVVEVGSIKNKTLQVDAQAPKVDVGDVAPGENRRKLCEVFACLRRPTRVDPQLIIQDIRNCRKCSRSHGWVIGLTLGE